VSAGRILRDRPAPHEASRPDAAAAGGTLRRVASGARARWLAAGLAVALAVRLATLGAYPLADTSEARYGEIARVMRQTGNWVTPQETPGTPFWAKPPLSTWLAASSTYLFGVDEFALRLPSLLCGFGVLALCAVWAGALARRTAMADHPSAAARERGGGESAGDAPLLACLILATTVLFFVGYGAVMTDPPLGLCTAWMMVAFQRAVIDASRQPVWRYGFFVAAGLAMLAKGPVAFLYVALPIALWAFWRGGWRRIWQALPWAGGTLLSAAISVPWYVWAERRTPGFLDYFLVGEHLKRFLVPGWTGDLYGTAHSEPTGTIWAYLAAAMGLWSIAVAALVVFPARGWVVRARAWLGDDGRLFAALAALAPLAVFTFAGNLIWTYVMPSLAPLAVLTGLALAQRSVQPGPWRLVTTLLAVGSVALVSAGGIGWAPQRNNGFSFARPVSAWRQRQQQQPGPLLYWGRKPPASLRFYSRAVEQAAPDIAAPLAALAPGSRVYVAMVPEELPALRQLASAQPHPIELAVVGQVRHALIVEASRPRDG
jgi:4-amino-4-deoxy-L-arabinose transferase-like glycosyltransferase